MRPEIILLDEPTSALDPISTAKIEELIDELREHFTIVIVTHNMQQAARVSQRTAFFHLGELVEDGRPTQIFTNPRDSGPRTTSPAGSADGARTMQQPHGHTLKAFDQDLADLRALIADMGGFAEAAIEEAMRCLVERDTRRAAADRRRRRAARRARGRGRAAGSS